MQTGTVKFFKLAPDLFGFIVSDSGEEYFFHFNNHANWSEPDRIPKQGDRVEFDDIRPAKAGKKPVVGVWNFEPYVNYGDVCHERLGTTSQVGAYYVTGCDPYPDLSQSIRFKGTAAMYHSLRIHRDDVDKFVARVKKWEAAKLANPKTVLIYSNEVDSYFFSTKWEQPGRPKGFGSLTFDLPFMLKPTEYLPDGMITNRLELARVMFSYMKEIPNPSPEFQAESPLTLNTGLAAHS